MIRLDKYLSNLQVASRSIIAQRCKTGRIQVQGELVKKPDIKLQEGDTICIDEILSIVVRQTVTVLLHKPIGFVCSDIDDGGHPSYRQLLNDCPYVALLHVAGRLDRDTSGLVIVTSDGDLNHQIISPKHKLTKTYRVTCQRPVYEYELQSLSEGVTLDDGYTTLPALARYLDDSRTIIELQITEGKYHQVKRMLQAVGNEVTVLHRESIGPRNLDGLQEGEWRYLD